MNLLFVYFALSYFAVPLAMTVHSEFRRVFVESGPLMNALMVLSILVWPLWILFILLKVFKEDTNKEPLP